MIRRLIVRWLLPEIDRQREAAYLARKTEFAAARETVKPNFRAMTETIRAFNAGRAN